MQDISHLSESEKEKLFELLKAQQIHRASDDLSDYARLVLDQEPARHHLLLIDALEEVDRGMWDLLLVMMPPGSAKALVLDTPIPTPSGWTTMGELRVGDKVFDERGVPCNVTWVSPVWKNRPVYSVKTDCGDEIVADRDHEWLVRLCGKRPVFKIKETHELCKSRAKRPMIKRAAHLSLPDADVPIDPYVLGVWLGDGSSAGVRITSSVDDQVWLRAEIERLGYKTSDSSCDTLFGILGIRGEMVNLGLINDPAHNTYGKKHIPDAYMRGSYSQRLSLLQGLIDTDGTVCKNRGCATFCNTNKELAIQVRELVRTLGVKAGWAESPAMLNGKRCGTAYRVSFYHSEAARMPRKRALCRDQYRTPDTYIDVEPSGFADTVCIEVDSPSHLFLCGESMTPTHNSTYGSVAFASWYLGRHPNRCVIAASHTQELAERFGRRVRNIVGGDVHKAVFPKSQLSVDSTAAGRWETSLGGEYFAAGVGGSVTGRRADLAIIDDPVKSREDADSQTIREKQWAWWRDDMSTRLKPGAAVVLIMTRWHEDDLAGRMLADLKGTSQRVRIISLPMEARESDPLGRNPGEMLWPEWFTPQMLETAKREPRTWSALYQQEPRPIGGGEFREEWVNFYRSAPATGGRVILVDPASGKHKDRGDYTAMWVIGTGQDGNHYVLDGVRDRLNLTERSQTLFDLVRRWRPNLVGYEQYGLQADIEFIRAEQERQQYRFRIIELGGGIKKEDRIRRLIPLFETGRIWMPEQLIKTCSDGVRRDIVDDFIEQEYLSFPVAAHDDSFDCLARMRDDVIVRALKETPRTVQHQSQQRPYRPVDSAMGMMG